MSTKNIKKDKKCIFLSTSGVLLVLRDEVK
nr:MAG TPA: hypothetical protein [Caudoviricetes sp.]